MKIASFFSDILIKKEKLRRSGSRDAPVPVRTSELGAKPFGYPVGPGAKHY